MYERHDNEQYFFDGRTLEQLAEFVSSWTSPCCLCAPLLGQHLAELGISVTILDIDTRFAGTKGFRKYDLYRPEWLGTEFDLILCDPPFFNVSLSQLFSAIRMLARNDFQQQILISYLERRSEAVVNVFSPFRLSPTGYFPRYQTVRDTDKNRIEMFGNLDATQVARLGQLDRLT